MGDDERRARAATGAQPGQHLLLGLGVERGQGVVQDQDARIARQRTGQRRALLLSARERETALAHHRLVARREVLHVLVELRQARRLEHAHVVVRRQTEGHVGAHALREQERLLRDHADRTAQARERQRVHVPAVHEDRPGRRLEEPWQELHERALACTRRAHDRDCRASRRVEPDVDQCRPRSTRVGERQGFHVDGTSERARILRQAVVRDLDPSVEQRQEPAHRGLTALDQVQHRPSAIIGHCSIARYAEKATKSPRLMWPDTVSRPPRNTTHTGPQAHEELNAGIQAAVDAHQPAIALEIGEVAGLEAPALVRLLNVGAHHTQAREMLLHQGAHGCELGLHFLEAVVHTPPEATSHVRDEHQRHHGQHEQQRADRRHQRHRGHEGRDGRGRVHGPRPEHHAHGRQVRHRAAHDVARALALIVGGREPQQVREQVVAQLELDLAADTDEHAPRDVAEDTLDGDEAQEQPRVAPQLAERCPALQGVDRGAQDPRRCCGEDGGQDEREASPR